MSSWFHQPEYKWGPLCIFDYFVLTPRPHSLIAEMRDLTLQGSSLPHLNYFWESLGTTHVYPQNKNMAREAGDTTRVRCLGVRQGYTRLGKQSRACISSLSQKRGWIPQFAWPGVSRSSRQTSQKSWHTGWLVKKMLAPSEDVLKPVDAALLPNSLNTPLSIGNFQFVHSFWVCLFVFFVQYLALRQKDDSMSFQLHAGALPCRPTQALFL